MATTFVLGPIDNGSSFMLASVQNGVPYILNAAPFGTGIIYYWESDLKIIYAAPTLPVFSAQGTPSAANITDSVNGGGIAFRSDAITLGNADTPTALKFSQTSYATWWPPDTFLSGAVYTIFNSAGATAGILTNAAGTGASLAANNVIILPVNWFFSCTSSGSYDSITAPSSSAVNWACVINGSDPACKDLSSIVKSGWTNLADCQNGVVYKYCTTSQTCGVSNCNGPCSVLYDDCTYSSSSSNYSCVFNPEKFVTETKWYTTPWFIGIVIGIAALILVIVIIMFAVLRHGKATSPPPAVT